MNTATFGLKKTYNFRTLSPVILGAEYKNMKVISILANTEAVKYSDISTLHTTIKNDTAYPISGLPSNVTDLTYILFQNASGDKVVMASEYIDPYSITEVVALNAVVTVNNITSADMSVIRTILAEAGYSNISMTTSNS